MSSRGGRAVAAGGLLALALALAHRLFLGPDLWPAGADAAALAAHTLAQLRGGWAWTELLGGGHPVYANPLSSTWYPLLTGPIALLGPGPGLVASIVMHLWLGGMAFHALAGRCTARAELRFLGAALFMASGGFAARAAAGHLNLLFPLAWTPLALHLLLGAAAGEGRRRVAGAAAVLGLVGLVDFQALLYLGLAAAGVALANGVAWGPGLPRLRARPLLALASCFTVGLALAGVKLLPVLGFAQRVRHGVEPFQGGLPLAQQAGWFLGGPRGEAAQGLGSHEFDLALGVAPMALAVLGAMAYRGPWRRALLASLAVLALFALGLHGPLAPLRALPPLDQLRVPARALLVALPVVVLLAVLGLEALPRALARAPAGAARVAALGLGGVAAVQAFEVAVPPLVFLALNERYAWYKGLSPYDVTPVDALFVLWGAALAAWVVVHLGSDPPPGGSLRERAAALARAVRPGGSRFAQALGLVALATLFAAHGSLYAAGPSPATRGLAEGVAEAMPPGFALVDLQAPIPAADFVLAGVPLHVGYFGASGDWLGPQTVLEPGVVRVGQRALHVRDFLVVPQPLNASVAEAHGLALHARVVSNPWGAAYVYRDAAAAPAAFVARGGEAVPMPVRVGPGVVVLDAPPLGAGERVVVKQRFYPGWEAPPGFRAVDEQQLLALEAEAPWAGGVLEARFAPRDLLPGAALSLLGLAALAGLARPSRPVPPGSPRAGAPRAG